MRLLEELPIGREPEHYIDSLVEAHGLAFSVLSIERNWEYSAIAPRDTPAIRLKEFERGGLCTQAESQYWLKRFCGSILQREQRLTFLVEDMCASSSDTIPMPQDINTGKVGDAVVYWADLRPGRTELISTMLSWTISFRKLCFLVRGKADLDNIENLVGNMLNFIVSAYDDESFLVGRKVT